MMGRVCEGINGHGGHGYLLASPEEVYTFFEYRFVKENEVKIGIGISSDLLHDYKYA
jgi:hypothetical protein